MLASYQRVMDQGVRVIVCPLCGEVLGLAYGGDRVPEAIHICEGDEPSEEKGEA